MGKFKINDQVSTGNGKEGTVVMVDPARGLVLVQDDDYPQDAAQPYKVEEVRKK